MVLTLLLLCPKNWHLPTSRSTGEWAALNTAVNGGVSNADAGLRTYPVNLIWSGDYNASSRTSGYGNGRYWASTGYDANNAYRMGHQESGSKGATPSGNYRKWDGFAIRCIRDEITADYYDVTVTFPTGVESITFENNRYGTEIATPNDNVVSLAENTAYTITANFTAGYELDAWSNGQNSTIGSTTINPTTLSITDDTTLTLTVQAIPSYTVNVTFDNHVTSIGFYNANYPAQQATTTGSIVHLYSGVEYIITATTESNYTIDSWSTTAGGTVGDITASTTTYSITNTTSLSLTTRQKIIATLDIGRVVNNKLTYIFTEDNDIDETIYYNYTIDAIRSSTILPEDFMPKEINTISVEGSTPIYIFPTCVSEDNNYNCTVNIYTEADEIYMNEDSSWLFSNPGEGRFLISNINFVSDWNTSNVTNMSHMFEDSHFLTNIDGTANWDTGNVTNMSYMFGYARSLTNIDGTANWDTGNVTNMSYMFDSARSLTNIGGAANWDTGNVTNMGGMFRFATSLTDASAINNWNISNAIKNDRELIKNMFVGTPTHPVFTNYPGKWGNGSFFSTATSGS